MPWLRAPCDELLLPLAREAWPTLTARDGAALAVVLKKIAARLVEPILSDFDFTGSPTIVMMNGMGGTPLIELYLMYNEVTKLLAKAGVPIARCLVGNYITSLEMAGCSVTLLRADDELVRRWDAPVDTAGLRWGR